MKHAHIKLTGLLLVLMLVLSGCNLIAVDHVKEIAEEFETLKSDYSAVVADYDGGQVKLIDVMNYYGQQMYYLSFYQQLGYNVTSADVNAALQDTAEYGVRSAAIAKEFEKRGLSLTDEEMENAKSSAEKNWQEAYDAYYAEAEGKTDEERAAQTEYNLYADGYSKEILEANSVLSAQYEKLSGVVQDEISELTEEELVEAFNAKVSADEDKYGASPYSFESAMSSDTTTVYWVPEGYRTVKHILIIPEEEILKAVTDARSAYTDAAKVVEDLESQIEAMNDDDAEETTEDAAEETTDEAAGETSEEEAEPAVTVEDLEAQLAEARTAAEALKADVEAAEAACLASQQEKLDEIYARIEAGEDFAALIEAYGEDPGMQNEPTKTRGYYVCENSTRWDANFKNAAMALSNVGDVTETPAIGSSGIHIIRYESDVAAGPVDLESVRDALYEETLNNAKSTHLSEAINSWVEALNPVYHLDAFK